MQDADAPLVRSQSIRDRAVELRRQFNVVEALFESGRITRTDTLSRYTWRDGLWVTRGGKADVYRLSTSDHRNDRGIT